MWSYCTFLVLFQNSLNRLTSSIFIAQVRETPYISKAYNLSCNSQEELNFAWPLSSGLDAGNMLVFAYIQPELAFWTIRNIHGTTMTERSLE